MPINKLHVKVRKHSDESVNIYYFNENDHIDMDD